MADQTQTPNKPKEKTPDELVDYTYGGPDKTFVVNPPKDKQLTWVTDAYLEKGFYRDQWSAYTLDHLRQDNKVFGTMLGNPFRVEGDRVCILASHLRFRPIEHLRREEAAKAQREAAIRRSMVQKGPGQGGELREAQGGTQTYHDLHRMNTDTQD